MASISSATTLTVTGYLTETGRKYLFGTDRSGNSLRRDGATDLFRPEKFSLYDSDNNYRSGERLDSGDLVGLAGTKGNTCLNTMANQRRKYALINGVGTLPTISFEKPLYELNEGDSILIRVDLSHFTYSLQDKKALISIKEEGTNLSVDDYLLQLPNGGNILFRDGVAEIEFVFDSLTDQTITKGTNREVVLKLSDYFNAIAGEFPEATIRVKGNGPLPTEINFRTPASQINSSNQAGTTESLIPMTEILLDKNSEESEVKANLKIELSENLSAHDDFIITIYNSNNPTDSVNPGFMFTREEVKSSIESNGLLPLFYETNYSQIGIVVNVGILPNIPPGQEATIKFTLLNPQNNTIIGSTSVHTLTITSTQVLKTCTPVSLVDSGFDFGMDKWQQIKNTFVPRWLDLGITASYPVAHYGNWALNTPANPEVDNTIFLQIGGSSNDYDRSKLPSGVGLVDYIREQTKEKQGFLSLGKTLNEGSSGYYTKIVYQQIAQTSGSYKFKMNIRTSTLGTPSDVLFNARLYVLAGNSVSTAIVLGEKKLNDTVGVLGSFTTYEIPVTLTDAKYIGFFFAGIDGASGDSFQVSYPVFGEGELKPIPIPGGGQVRVRPGTSTVKVPWPLNIEVDKIQIICDEVVETPPPPPVCISSIDPGFDSGDIGGTWKSVSRGDSFSNDINGDRNTTWSIKPSVLGVNTVAISAGRPRLTSSSFNSITRNDIYSEILYQELELLNSQSYTLDLDAYANWIYQVNSLPSGTLDFLGPRATSVTILGRKADGSWSEINTVAINVSEPIAIGNIWRSNTSINIVSNNNYNAVGLQFKIDIDQTRVSNIITSIAPQVIYNSPAGFGVRNFKLTCGSSEVTPPERWICRVIQNPSDPSSIVSTFESPFDQTGGNINCTKLS